MQQKSRTLSVCALCVGAAALTSTASGQVMWSEDFDSYAPGSGIKGQGGWDAWDGDGAYDSPVTDAISRSADNSLDILPTSDSIYEFDENLGVIDCGAYTLTVWSYCDSDTYTGQSHIILLNTYAHGGPNNWSTQVKWDGAIGMLDADFDHEQMPIIYDEWVEVRIEIDLDNNEQSFYYGGDLLYTDTWTERVSGGGQLALECLDMWGNNATSLFWDDFELTQTASCVCLTLEVNRLVAGSTATWDVSEATPGERVAIVYGFEDGETKVEGTAGFCATFGIKGVSQKRLICMKAADGAGIVSCNKKIPLSAEGLRVLSQAAERDTCPDECMSNLVDQVVQ